MQHVFWLRPGRISGRSGPNTDPWVPAQLAQAGIGSLLSVNDAASVYSDDLAAAGIEHACMPMEDNAPPRPGDFERCIEILPLALEFIQHALRRQRKLLIHCTAGKDRTGLTMCHYLCQCEGYTPQQAIREVRRVRPQALSATGYEAFAVEVLHALQKG